MTDLRTASTDGEKDLELDLDEVRRLVKRGRPDKEDGVLWGLAKGLKKRVEEVLLGRIDPVVREAEERFRETRDADDGRALLVAMIDRRVGPQWVDPDVLGRALLEGTETGKKAIEYVGHGIAAGAFSVCGTMAGLNPVVVVRFERGGESRARIGLKEDRWALGLELTFQTIDLRPDMWRKAADEFEEALGRIKLSGGEPWHGVRVRKANRMIGLCVLSGWHEFNHPMLITACRKLLVDEGEGACAP